MFYHWFFVSFRKKDVTGKSVGEKSKKSHKHKKHKDKKSKKSKKHNKKRKGFLIINKQFVKVFIK